MTTKECWVWQCACCQRQCVPIRSQSRCMCGHRLVNHTKGSHGCSSAGCSCPRFTFIVAEGAWILKCRCKHKHTDHNPAAPHSCSKASCSCSGFGSPWVCNCDHPWADHQQLLVSKEVLTLADMLAQQQLGDPQAAATAQTGSNSTGLAASGKPEAVLVEGDLTCEVNRFDLIQRGAKDAAT